MLRMGYGTLYIENGFVQKITKELQKYPSVSL